VLTEPCPQRGALRPGWRKDHCRFAVLVAFTAFLVCPVAGAYISGTISFQEPYRRRGFPSAPLCEHLPRVRAVTLAVTRLFMCFLCRCSSLDLHNNNLNGTLPERIGELASLM
jgi:hypothetical protein